jgi:hypothetical protein
MARKPKEKLTLRVVATALNGRRVVFQTKVEEQVNRTDAEEIVGSVASFAQTRLELPKMEEVTNE